MAAVITRKNIPNFITSIRIIGTICLLFIEAFTKNFFIVYTLAGITDVLDGYVARKMKLTSEFGAKLDSFSDLLFYTIMFVKIFPILYVRLPMIIWIAVGIILCVRLSAYIIAALKYKRFASLHTYMNKATGAGVFLLPYIINTPALLPFSVMLSLVAGVASMEELIIHIKNKDYNINAKSIRW